MARELRRLGVPHELVVIEDGDHSFSRAEWRLRLYSKIEAFLASQLGS